MNNDHKNTQEFTFKISVSPEPNQSESDLPENEPIVVTLEDQFELLECTSIMILPARRYTEHGQSQVQILRFVEPDQRQKVLQLLNQSLPGQLPALYRYLFQLGFDPNGERRYYAALGVGELTAEIGFLDLKEDVVLPWAKSQKRLGQQSAALALSRVARDERFYHETLTLLHHWITCDNEQLNMTALLTYYSIGRVYPQEILTVIEEILLKEKLLLSLLIVEIVRSIYDLYPDLVVEQLHRWVLDTNPKENELLRYTAGILFLSIVQIDDIPEQDLLNTRTNAADIIFALWEDLKMPLHSELQKDTTKLIKRWAQEAISDEADESLVEICRSLFTNLYQKYAREKRRNRLEFYLKKWQRHKPEFGTLIP